MLKGWELLVDEEERQVIAKHICHGETYVEAIFVGDVLFQNVDAIRIGKEDHDRLCDLAFHSYQRELSEPEKYEMSLFASVKRLMRKHEIRWEIVDEDRCISEG